PPPRTLRPGLPRDLETVCLKCLAKRPADRYATCAALADDLRRWLEGEPVRARRLGAAERAWRWARRNPLPAALGAAAGLLLVLAPRGAPAGLGPLRDAAAPPPRRPPLPDRFRTAIPALQKDPKDQPPWDLAADEAALAVKTGAGQVTLWGKDARKLGAVTSPLGMAHVLRLTPDGRLLVVGCEEGFAVWDVADQRLRTAVRGPV